MSSAKVCFVFLAGILAFQLVESKHRFARSPDKVEMDLPNYSSEQGDQEKEFNDQKEDEEQYWQGEAERGQEKYENLEEDREKTRQEYEEKYENDKKHYEEQQESLNKEAEDNYNANRDNIEEHQRNNEAYLYERAEQNNDNRGEEMEEFRNEIESKGSRYGNKGADFASDREHDMENFEMEGKGPSISYKPE